ncbi:DUF2281 domain-containing protein [Treponema sp.]|uniref:type II toxin-antitoxin system VapB family antitoxin n=1 Tax=Treponema sp. TaxID=166 RepID=UPI00298DA3E2|nr:DUF2281 domain-containing protein [Treponema sp.]MCR5613234.1 DUF2281 domain-containing protein [Treponema sp.]
MSYADLKKEIETLPQAALSEIIDFVRLIKLKYSEENNLSAKKSVYGVWKNDSFYMSPDFDEPLEDFMEYMSKLSQPCGNY